jgi:hypothetical protein
VQFDQIFHLPSARNRACGRYARPILS